MLIRKYLIIAPMVLLLGLCLVPPGELMAQIESEALGGVASSQQEGNMEGVVVSARRDGANFTVSVVSNAEGRYSFPRSHVEPGTYTVTTRANNGRSGGATVITRMGDEHDWYDRRKRPTGVSSS